MIHVCIPPRITSSQYVGRWNVPLTAAAGIFATLLARACWLSWTVDKKALSKPTGLATTKTVGYEGIRIWYQNSREKKGEKLGMCR
jgi:hypothetical protein